MASIHLCNMIPLPTFSNFIIYSFPNFLTNRLRRSLLVLCTRDSGFEPKLAKLNFMTLAPTTFCPLTLTKPYLDIVADGAHYTERGRMVSGAVLGAVEPLLIHVKTDYSIPTIMADSPFAT